MPHLPVFPIPANRHRTPVIAFCLLLAACSQRPVLSADKAENEVTATRFFREAAMLKGLARDSLALAYLQQGNFPSFLKKMEPVSYSFVDNKGQKHEATIWVTPDYMAIGSDDDWARIPLTPMAGQSLAGSMNCVLPTPSMVDAIYQAAKVKLEPVPLYAFRDSTPVFLHHHLIIEGQRGGRKGLIAGIKKDVVRDKDPGHNRGSDRVIIYGWHRLDGKPIQPVYSGHVNWYVDYSHGVRLVSKKIKLDGKWTGIEEMERMMDDGKFENLGI